VGESYTDSVAAVVDIPSVEADVVVVGGNIVAAVAGVDLPPYEAGLPAVARRGMCRGVQSC